MSKEYESFMLDKPLKDAITRAEQKLTKSYDGIKLSRSHVIRYLIEKGLNSLKITVK